MPLTNVQFDALMREYEQTRRRHRDEQEARLAEVYGKIPAFHTADMTAPDAALAASNAIAQGLSPDFEEIRNTLSRLSAEKKRLLRENGYAEDYTELQFDCPDCRDTGFCGTERCHCLNRRIRDILYEQSRLSSLITENNFDMMSEEYHTGDDRRRFQSAVGACRRFVRGMTEENGYDNLLFFGPVGSGKTFLSIATAKELLDAGCSVLYFSAVSLFDRLSETAFSQELRSAHETLRRDLSESDVLVIDDLGTELTNAFVSSRLFDLINERHLARHATIISTNLDFRELRDRYSDRVFSRLASNYTVCELTGSDVRLARKAASRKGTV
ncbi:MAG: ATP-binding protein [Lachnospiraceae bacterium]|nr:ATP-binding protein [Lachnospiraceae bacterium]